MKIVEKSGNIMVEYYYDGYGKIVYSTNNDLSKINPYKYRGYYYDIESGWYYLNNRYYDNKTCRFVTMDDIEYLGESGTIHSYNLFIYCEGNLVRYVDPSGHKLQDEKYYVVKDHLVDENINYVDSKLNEKTFFWTSFTKKIKKRLNKFTGYTVFDFRDFWINSFPNDFQPLIVRQWGSLTFDPMENGGYGGDGSSDKYDSLINNLNKEYNFEMES